MGLWNAGLTWTIAVSLNSRHLFDMIKLADFVIYLYRLSESNCWISLPLCEAYDWKLVIYLEREKERILSTYLGYCFCSLVARGDRHIWHSWPHRITIVQEWQYVKAPQLGCMNFIWPSSWFLRCAQWPRFSPMLVSEELQFLFYIINTPVCALSLIAAARLSLFL